MKKIIALVLVLIFAVAMLPSAFASAGGVVDPGNISTTTEPTTEPTPEPKTIDYGPCVFTVYESNGDGTHTIYCRHGYWHYVIEECYSDNNNNGKCDFCGYITGEMDALTAGTALPLTSDMLGGFEPGSVNVECVSDDEEIVKVEIIDGVVSIVPLAEGETFLRVLVSGVESRIIRVTVLPAPVAEEAPVEEAAE